jgi:hypothetical protein
LCEVFRAFAPAKKKKKKTPPQVIRKTPQRPTFFFIKKIKVEQNKEIFATDDCKFAREEKSLALSLSLQTQHTTRKYTLRS